MMNEEGGESRTRRKSYRRTLRSKLDSKYGHWRIICFRSSQRKYVIQGHRKPAPTTSNKRRHAVRMCSRLFFTPAPAPSFSCFLIIISPAPAPAPSAPSPSFSYHHLSSANDLLFHFISIRLVGKGAYRAAGWATQRGQTPCWRAASPRLPAPRRLPLADRFDNHRNKRKTTEREEREERGRERREREHRGQRKEAGKVAARGRDTECRESRNGAQQPPARRRRGRPALPLPSGQARREGRGASNLDNAAEKTKRKKYERGYGFFFFLFFCFFFCFFFFFFFFFFFHEELIIMSIRAIAIYDTTLSERSTRFTRRNVEKKS